MIKTARFYNNLRIIYTGKRQVPYTIDGAHDMNGGQVCEAIAKNWKGLDWHIDAHTKYNEGSDIPEYSASVKSNRATLVSEKLGATLETSLDVYFQNVASTNFWYVTRNDNDVTVYMMDAKTFRIFLEKFAKLNERGYVRLTKETRTMLYWLNYEAR